MGVPTRLYTGRNGTPARTIRVLGTPPRRSGIFPACAARFVAANGRINKDLISQRTLSWAGDLAQRIARGALAINAGLDLSRK